MDTIETHQQATHLDPSDTFVRRHLGPRQAEIPQMLQTLGCNSLEELIDQTIPASIRMTKPLALGPARSEHELLGELRTLAKKNHLLRSYIGMGYYGTITPPVIQRNVLESPGWYTQYTPYQAEIAQGRLEALLNFQTMVADLTGMPLANASLLDEATACAEAMAMCSAVAGGRRRERNVFFVSDHCHPQNIAVVQSRAKSMGVQCVVGSLADLDLSLKNICGALLSYPTTDGRIEDYGAIIEDLHEHGALAVVVTDLLALTLLTPPSEFKADIVVGSTQRFGCPMGFGGPHAGFLATHEAHARKIPGRIIGVSKDRHERSGYRLTLQTREQHIRRDKATSNICTAQVLPAILASMYAVYHGPQGLIRIAQRVRSLTCILRQGLIELGCQIDAAPRFDTLRVAVPGVDATQILAAAVSRQMNLREFSDGSVGISLDETTSKMDVTDLLSVFSGVMSSSVAPRSVDDLAREVDSSFPPLFARSQEFMKHPVFNSHHSETEMLRYMARLQSRDLSLTMSMIPLGSCTMKLNGTTEMIPITWPEFAHLHPFVPAEQSSGYAELFQRLEKDLAEITGFAGISLQPNAGSQGEYAGLLVIHAYHESLGEGDRDICLIPVSAHGTNPASAIIAGFRVVTVKCDENGNVDVQDLAKKADKHQKELGALMVTYPSTHGVFEERIQEICKIVHDAGGQVYMDGANMNAQVGLCRPADMGADVCHLNLHKTFCIPHGGGGPGMGPIGVAPQLLPFLPGHPVVPPAGAGEQSVGAIAAAPYGSPSILPISFLYIELMGAEGLKRATQIAILNANYMAKRLEEHYDILYRGKNGRVAHEFIIDLRPFDKAGVKIDDVAKRLIDYGYHAPTMSFPVPGTLMIEPTESESLQELDRYCEALISIRKEIEQVVSGKWSPKDNPLHNAPHTMRMVCSSEWTHPYSREEAAFPTTHLQEFKFWPVVSRIDNYYGDRNLFCTCPMPSD